LSNVQPKFLNLSVFELISILEFFNFYLEFTPFHIESVLHLSHFELVFLVGLKGIFDFFDFHVFGSFQCLEFGLPSVDVSDSLIEVSFEFSVVLVHCLNLFQGLVIFGLDIRINLRYPLLVFFKLQSLLLDKLL
jgi:hypothetical protein